MGKMGSEYLYTINYQNRSFDIVGCWDSNTPNNEFSFFDIYENNECLNLGFIYDNKPDLNDIKNLLTINKEL